MGPPEQDAKLRHLTAVAVEGGEPLERAPPLRRGLVASPLVARPHARRVRPAAGVVLRARDQAGLRGFSLGDSIQPRLDAVAKPQHGKSQRR